MLVSVVTIAFQCLSLPTLTKNILTGTSPITTRTSKYMHLYLRHGWASLECRAISSCTLYLRLPTSVLINAHCKPANYVYRTFANSTYALYQWCLCKPCVNHQVWCTNTIVEQSSNHFDCIVAFLSVQLRKRWKSGLLSLRGLCACRARSSFDRLKSPFFPASR